MTADERFDSLERKLSETQRELAAAKERSRRQMLAALAIAAALATVWLTTESTRPAYAQDAERPLATVRARGFVLVDDKGRTRGEFTMAPSGPILTLLDEKDQVRVGLGASDKLVTSLMLLDQKGEIRAMLCASDELGPTLSLNDEKGISRVSLYAGAKLGSALSLYDEKGDIRVGLSAARFGPDLSLYDEKGENRASLNVMLNGPELSLYDENGKRRATIGATVTETPDGRKIANPESSIFLFDPDGKTIWQAPR